MVVTSAALEAALHYAELGYSVFPCGGEDGKKPACKNGLLDATQDEAQLTKWFGKKKPPNVAIATEGLFVIDIDPVPNPTKKSPRKFIENPWPQDPAQQMDLGMTVSSKTPRGGRHFVFRDEACEFRNSAKKLAPHVDVRASGGYIVVAPSVGPGGPYEWQTELQPVDDLPEVPGWARELLEAAGSPASVGGTKRSEEDWLELIAGGTGEGARNATMASMVGKWISQGMDPPEVLAMAICANQLNRPPMDIEEVQTIVRSVLQTDQRNKPATAKKAEAALETLREAGVEVPAGFAKKVEQQAKAKADEQQEEQREATVATMGTDDATNWLATEFAWLPERVVRVEEFQPRAGYEEFWLVLESGRRVDLGTTSQLMQVNRFEEVIFTEFRLLVPKGYRKKGAWRPIVQAIGRAAVVVDPDFSPEDAILEQLRDYCADVRRGAEQTRLHKAGQPYILDGELRVQVSGFVSWLKVSRDVRATGKEVCALLTKLGMPRRKVLLADPDAPTKRLCRNYCCGPAAILDQEGGES